MMVPKIPGKVTFWWKPEKAWAKPTAVSHFTVQYFSFMIYPAMGCLDWHVSHRASLAFQFTEGGRAELS